VAQSVSDMAYNSREVIDHMARLDFEIKPEGGNLVSFHFEYNDYLEEIGKIDPITAKENALKTKHEKENNTKKGMQPAEQLASGGVLPATNNGDLDIEEMDEGNDVETGRFKFENVLKSMVARLELYNNLAPI
jgi:hypothetical protein